MTRRSVMLRRCALIAAVAAVAGLAAAAGSAEAKTIRVKWTDSQPWGGGHITYRTSKIWVRGDRYSVTVSITNRSKYEIRFFPSGSYNPPYTPPLGFGIAWHEPLQHGTIQGNALRSVAPTTFSLSIPRTLGIGKKLNLTFSGRSPLLRTHRKWWVTFGIVFAWNGKHTLSDFEGPHGMSWVSDKTFST